MVLIEKPIIAVTGATGLQGGSVVRFLLKDGTFRVRALTRKPDSPKAHELQAKGAEVVAADYSDFTSLVAAFQGAYGVFGVTQYWEGMSGEKEELEGTALVDAAKACGVQHFVWSTVNASPNLHVEHWTSKARVNAHLLASGLARTSLYTTFYFENFVLFDFCRLKKLSASSSSSSYPPPLHNSTSVPRNGVVQGLRHKYVADWPLLLTDGPIGGFSVSDTGAYALEAFKNPQKWIDADMHVAPDIFTPRGLVSAVNEVLRDRGEPGVDLHEVNAASFERARDLGAVLGGAEQMWGNMSNFYKAKGKMRYVNTGMASSSDIARAEAVERAIYTQRWTMREFVGAHVDELLATALEAE